MLASGRVDDLIGSSTTWRVRVGDRAAAARVLTGAGMGVRADGDHLVVDNDGPPEQITRLLAAEEMYVAELTPVRADLESVFLELTGDATLGHGPDLGAEVRA
jgi:ABC-2 type transport system ATP-binding protein